MARSPRIRVYYMQLNALLRLAFATATYLRYLTLLHTVTRWAIKQKVRRHPLTKASTAYRCLGSGTISLPSRGAFHLSLTVLVHYRSLACI